MFEVCKGRGHFEILDQLHLRWANDEGELKKVVLDAVFDVSWMAYDRIKPGVPSLNRYNTIDK